jgi:DNA-binding response OmpR family regulator
MPVLDYRVLLIEDEHEIAEMLAIYFHNSGFFLFHAANGQEALLRAPAILPHVILMDITLPDIDGYEICRRMRRQPRTAHIPIIFLTKRGSRDDRLAGLGLGADDFISKPFDVEELLLRIRNSVRRAETEMQTDPRTGLPSARMLRPLIQAARARPNMATLELTIENLSPYREQYGMFACTEVFVYLADLIKRGLQSVEGQDDFIGYLDEQRYVVVCQNDEAKAVIDRIIGPFNQHADKHYKLHDLEDGHLLIDDQRYPLMSISVRRVAPSEEWPD